MERESTIRQVRSSIPNYDFSSSSAGPGRLPVFDRRRPNSPPFDQPYSDAPVNSSPGKGIRATRSRPALASIFPNAALHQSQSPDDSNDQGFRRSTSNELTLAPGDARASLVNNILMSFDDTDLVPASAGTSRFERPRGHTYSSSTSSVFQNISSPATRPRSRSGHSKNKSSGSNFRATFDKITGGRAGARNLSQSPVDYRRNHQSATFGKAQNSAGRQPEYGQSPQRPDRTARRSISLEQGRQRFLVHEGRFASQADMDAEDAVGSDAPDADRTAATSASRRRPHRGSTGSVDSQSLRPGRAQPTGLRKAGTSPQRPSDGMDAAMQGPDDGGDPPASAVRREPRVQAAAIASSARHKNTQSSSYKATAYSPNATLGKDKGGFFKRMFGSSARSASSSVAESQAQASQHSMSRSGSQQVTPSQSVSGSFQRQSTMQPPVASKPEPKEPAVLNKKASFFRRRKKSIAAPPPEVPILPSSVPRRSRKQSRDQSPTSSLRQVMNPYLANSRPETRAGQAAGKTYGEDVLGRLAESQRIATDDGDLYNTVSSSTYMTDDSQSTQKKPSAPWEEAEGAETRPRGLAMTVIDRINSLPPNTEIEERPSRRTTVTASSTAPNRSSSKGWRDRPQNRAAAPNQPRRSTSEHRPSDTVRPETDASEASDGDFTSAKSQAVSPLEAKAAQPNQPPVPRGPPPSVPTMTLSVEPIGSNPASRDHTTLDPAITPTYAPQDESAKATHVEIQAVKPSEEDEATAFQLFHFDDEVPPDEPGLPSAKSDICAWLGDAGEERARVREAYLAIFDWKDTSILAALRKFCEHVQLKGETQQVDRVLEGIARRWTECNVSHGFKAVDVVHTICYSLILLNTDLHLADIESKMTRPQFVKNTMPTIMRVVDDAAPDAFKQSTIAAAKRASMMPPAPLDLNKQATAAALNDGPVSPTTPASPRESGTVKLSIRRNSNEFQRGKFRLSSKPSESAAVETLLGENRLRGEPEPVALANEDAGPLVKQPFFGGRAAWEIQIETVLKNFYNGIQKQRLPLQGSDTSAAREQSRAPSSIGNNPPTRVGRSGSISSRQSGGERGRESRPTTGTTGRFKSKFSQRPRIYAASNFSVDDDMSMAGGSPSASSLWSKQSLGRTQTSMSVASFRSEAPGQEAYQQSIGFANALSQAIIREEAGDGVDGDERDSEAIKAASLLDDDSLELYGAPWAKEGIVKHKHHLESVDKKAKERTWTECFAVIQKGWLQLFRFNSSKTSSIRARAMRAAVGGMGGQGGTGKGPAGPIGPGGKVIVGGGNWMDNALPLGRFLLRQSIASALPPPGYSKSRPHVWALSLPNGAVHLFQAGTPEIVKEYVACANYWSARLSKEPLVGGVSNVEYGWSEGVVGDVLAASRNTGSADRPASSIADAVNMARQRSGSNDSAAPTPGIPRTSTRGTTSSARPPSAMHHARPSLQTSIRGSFDTTSSAVVRPRLPGDSARISDWSPPQQSMVASALLEVDQLRVLTDYVSNIKNELEKHNELRPAIQAAYNQRHPNFLKAMSNFEKKSAYLLREIVKFSTYVEILQSAQAKKDEVFKERDDRKRKMEAERAKEQREKVDTAEELRRELSRSDLRIAAKADAVDEIPDVPALPTVAKGVTKS